jgi:transposase
VLAAGPQHRFFVGSCSKHGRLLPFDHFWEWCWLVLPGGVQASSPGPAPRCQVGAHNLLNIVCAGAQQCRRWQCGPCITVCCLVQRTHAGVSAASHRLLWSVRFGCQWCAVGKSRCKPTRVFCHQDNAGLTSATASGQGDAVAPVVWVGEVQVPGGAQLGVDTVRTLPCEHTRNSRDNNHMVMSLICIIAVATASDLPINIKLS